MTKTRTKTEPEMNMGPLMREAEAAKFLAVTIRALQAWRQRGGGPPFVRLGARAIRYSKPALEKYIAACGMNSTSEY